MQWAGAILLLGLMQAPDPSAEGMKALEEGRYQAAESSFLKAVEASPDDYAAHFHLALTRSLLGRYPEAIQGYRHVLTLQPGLYEAELNAGILLLQQGETAEAMGLLQSAAEKKPGEFRPNFHWGEALLRSGQPDQAFEAFQKAAEAQPQSAPAQVGLARAEGARKRLDEAARHYRKAVELDAEYRGILVELGSLYERAGRRDEAIAVYAEFPEQPAARERLSGLLLAAGRAEEAIAQLEPVVQSKPTAANRYLLATAYLRTKQMEKAAGQLRHAVELEPENTDLRLTYGRVLRDLKRYKEAATEFMLCARQSPQSREAWSELTGMLILTEDFPAALAALDRLQALGEAKPSLYYFRALVLDRSKNYEAALSAYEQFLSRSAGAHPEEEFLARQRVRTLQKELKK